MYCRSCGEQLATDADTCSSCGTSVGRSDEVVGGLSENVAGVLAYAFVFVSGLLLYVLEEDNEFVRFHALQSVLVFGGLALVLVGTSALGYVFGGIPVIGWALGLALWGFDVLVQLVGFVLWLVLMIKAYQGECFEVPVVGEVAAEYV